MTKQPTLGWCDNPEHPQTHEINETCVDAFTKVTTYGSCSNPEHTNKEPDHVGAPGSHFHRASCTPPLTVWSELVGKAMQAAVEETKRYAK